MDKDYGDDCGPRLNQGPWLGLDPMLGRAQCRVKARARDGVRDKAMG